MHTIPFACAALLATFLPAQRGAERDAPLLELQRTLSGHSRLVRCLAFASDGRLASGGQDRLICLWSAEGKRLHSVDLRPGGG